MSKYRKKPVVIEAMQFTQETADAVLGWIPARYCYPSWDFAGNPTVTINTLEGDMIAFHGDWIICGVKGEFYPCKPDIFEATYEAVEN